MHTAGGPAALLTLEGLSFSLAVWTIAGPMFHGNIGPHHYVEQTDPKVQLVTWQLEKGKLICI